jgi:arylsulfatase A-like enzyme
VGLVLQQLENDGFADNTVIFFIADHGESMVRGKQFCYEEGLHIPLIIRWPKALPAPKQIQPSKVDNRLIEAIDLAPTFLDLAEAKVPPKMEGRVFLGEHAVSPREYAFGARDRCDETVFRFRTARDDRYRYIRNFTPERPFLQPNEYKAKQYPTWTLLPKLFAEGKLTPAQAALCAPTMPPEELYELSTDPHEIHNLAGNPKYETDLKRLRAVVEKWITDTGDKGAEFEPEAVVQAKGATKGLK